MTLSSPPPPAGRAAPGRAAFLFIFTTVALDMLALGAMIPVLVPRAWRAVLTVFGAARRQPTVRAGRGARAKPRQRLRKGRKFGRAGVPLANIAAMRWLYCVLVFGSLPACLQLGKALNSDDAGTASAGTSGVAGRAGGTATGTNCGVDPSSGIALCLGISSCPTVRVDPDQFPDCGYRISGSTIDLECLCGDSLCPMGSAASCLDAKALLADQSAQGVCAEVADGQCTMVKQTSVTSTSACDKDCRAACGGDPNCVTLCGC